MFIIVLLPKFYWLPKVMSIEFQNTTTNHHIPNTNFDSNHTPYPNYLHIAIIHTTFKLLTSHLYNTYCIIRVILCSILIILLRLLRLLCILITRLLILLKIVCLWCIVVVSSVWCSIVLLLLCICIWFLIVLLIRGGSYSWLRISWCIFAIHFFHAW